LAGAAVTGVIRAGNDPLTRAEVCQLEGRLDSRFQAINARFTTMDRRFTSFAGRLYEIEQRLSALSAQHNQHVCSAAARLDALEARVDRCVDVMQPHLTPRDGWRTVAITIAVTSVVAQSVTWIVAWMCWT
jgi:hypothetical protein